MCFLSLSGGAGSIGVERERGIAGLMVGRSSRTVTGCTIIYSLAWINMAIVVAAFRTALQGNGFMILFGVSFRCFNQGTWTIRTFPTASQNVAAVAGTMFDLRRTQCAAQRKVVVFMCSDVNEFDFS